MNICANSQMFAESFLFEVSAIVCHDRIDTVQRQSISNLQRFRRGHMGVGAFEKTNLLLAFLILKTVRPDIKFLKSAKSP